MFGAGWIQIDCLLLKRVFDACECIQHTHIGLMRKKFQHREELLREGGGGSGKRPV